MTSITAHDDSSPKADRERRKSIVARSLSRALAAVGASQSMVAATLGLSTTGFARLLDGEANHALTVADALGLPPLVRRHIADLLAESLGCVLAEVPAAVGAETDLALAIDAQRETHEALAAHLSAIADGHITRAEAVGLQREVRQAQSRLAAIAQLAERALREGVVGTRLRAVGK
jgi:hypothetical protein